MTVQRVEQHRQSAAVRDQAVQLERERLTLFTASSFERVRSIVFGDGTQIAVPAMSDSDRRLAGKLFAAVATEKQSVLQEASVNFAQAIRAEAVGNKEGIKIGQFSSKMVEALGQTAEVYVTTTGYHAQDEGVQGVLYMGVIGLEQELAQFAKVVHANTQLAGELRTDMTELREALSDWPDDGSKQNFTWTEVTIDEQGNPQIVRHEDEPLTKKEAEDLVAKLEGQLSNVNDLTEMQKFDLQAKMHDYQEALGTLSELLKAMHDSLKTIIANVKS